MRSPCIARPHGRARIETGTGQSTTAAERVSPGLTAGRGLKLDPFELPDLAAIVSPGLTAGRGLKQRPVRHLRQGPRYRPASRPGAD